MNEHKWKIRHGMRRTRIYRIWSAMKNRCFNPKNKDYPRYGGRGIAVCERWLKFENFLADMGERPLSMSIDRIDNDGNYEPGNCRWATRMEQQNNQRKNRFFVLNGVTKTLSEWASCLGINRNTLQTRFQRGWPAERALSK